MGTVINYNKPETGRSIPEVLLEPSESQIAWQALLLRPQSALTQYAYVYFEFKMCMLCCDRFVANVVKWDIGLIKAWNKKKAGIEF